MDLPVKLVDGKMSIKKEKGFIIHMFIPNLQNFHFEQS